MLYFSALLKAQHPKFAASLEATLKDTNILYHYLNDNKDIWIKDWLPIQVAPDQFVQFSLTRDYYYKKDRHKQTDPTPICETLGIKPYIPIYNSMPIYLDGGNIIRGYGSAVITEKVLRDNKDIPRDTLAGFLRDVLKVDKVIFIPVEPKDDTGHSDGMVRFVDERTVVANDYSKIDVSQSFRDRFYGALAGAGLDVLLVPYNPSEERVNGYQSASGCYINFLQVGDKIFLPLFDDPVNDEAVMARFGEIFGAKNIIPVPSLELSLGGGVLNCATWEITA